MKKIVLMVMSICMSVASCQAQGSDPVIMTINGQDILRSEFEYSYNKNNSEGVIDKKSREEYVDLFINYKLKVAAAMDAHLDTLSSYKKEFRQYRDQQLYSSFVTDADMENEALTVYDNTKKSIGADGLVLPAHIFFRLPQNADAATQETKRQLADSVYAALMNGDDFASLAKRYSDDTDSGEKGGELSWISRGQAVKEFDEVAFRLQPGEVAKPVLSTLGYHIIKIKDKKQLEPFSELKPQIMKFLEVRNARQVIAKRNIEAKAADANLTADQLLDDKAAALSAEDMNMKYLIQEYHDGLLLYEISNRTVWDFAANDSIGQETFFRKNKKKYDWDEPRFKGIVYHTRDKADLKAVKKTIAKVPFSQWAAVLKNTFNNDTIFRIKAEKGIFKKGDNAFADKMVFKDKSASPTPVKDYPHDSFYGKMLKKGPEECADVRNLVVADYQEALEKAWVEDLRQKYTFSVNNDVLKTVNNH